MTTFKLLCLASVVWGCFLLQAFRDTFEPDISSKIAVDQLAQNDDAGQEMRAYGIVKRTVDLSWFLIPITAIFLFWGDIRKCFKPKEKDE